MKSNSVLYTVLAVSWLLFLVTNQASSHCDSLDGPVVKSARLALEDGRVDPVLRWVRHEDEAEIRAAFDQALRVRGLGPAARELADTHLFEALVRVHRAGEGAPYTGLKAAGTTAPAIVAADRAIENGDVNALADRMGAVVASGVRDRFDEVMRRLPHADESIEAGREFVEAYVAYVHYVEGIHAAASGAGGHDDASSRNTSAGGHAHE